MSLRIWLPLNGSLKNQGLDKVTVINNGATVDNNGKIGKCYYFDGSDDYISLGNSVGKYFNGSPFSITFWIRSEEDGTRGIIFSAYGLSSTSNFFALEVNGSSGTMDNYLRFDWLGADIKFFQGAITPNVWLHFAITYNGSKIMCYRNGEFYGDVTRTLSSIPIGNSYYLGRDSRTGTTALKGRLNDFRLYDHCLSLQEIKKISQGLILHYPLNRNGWDNENNIAISKVANRGCTNFTYNTSTQEWTMTCPSGSTSWGYGIVINDRNIKWATGQAWVISMDVYVPKSIYWQRDINNKPDLSDISQYTGNDYDVQAQRYAYTNRVSGQHLQTGWNHIWFSQTAPSTYGLSNYSTNWGIVTTNETSTIDIKIKNIKGEVISVGSVIKPTPWCPNSTDSLATLVGMNSTIVKDISGYQNNGTITGTLILNTNTSKYHVSTEFDGTNYIIADSPSTEGKTLSAWVKTNSTSNRALVIDYKSGLGIGFWSNYFIPSCNSSIKTTYVFSDFSINQWNHIVVTKPNSSSVLCYINGKLQTASSAQDYWSTGVIDKMSIASRPNGASPIACQISDVRIYSTALSADEIKELYEYNIVN